MRITQYPICPTASQRPSLARDLHLPHRPPRPERLRQRPLIQIIELTSHRQAMRQLRQPHRITLEPLGKIMRGRSEEHTSELQSLMRISYAVFCLKNTKNKYSNTIRET